MPSHTGTDIRFQQRLSLLCRGAVHCALCLCQNCCACNANTASSARSISPSASRRGFVFLGQTRTKRRAYDGQRLYGEQRFSEAAERCSTRTCRACALTADQAS